MKPSKKFSVKPLVLSSLTAFVLAACGGGGSGSGTAPPSGEIDLGIDSSGSSGDLAVLPLATEIKFTLDESLCAAGASCAGVQEKLTATLNGIEIKDLFTLDGNVASVNAYQLQGLIGEQNEKGAQSTLAIGVKDSGKSPASKAFSLDLSPQVVLLKSPKDTSANFAKATCDGLLTNLPESVLASECKDGLLGSYLNKNAANLEVKGIYRHDYLRSIKQVQGVGGADVATRPEFKVTGFQYAEGASKDQADFSFEVTNSKNTKTDFEFAVPGKELTDLLAAHVNEVKGDHVISQWINDAVVAYVEEELDDWKKRLFFPEQSLCKKVFVDLVGTPQADGNLKFCTLNIKSAKQDNTEGKFKFATEMGFVELLLSKDKDVFSSAWKVEVTAKTEKNQAIDMALEMVAYSDATNCAANAAQIENCKKEVTATISFALLPEIVLQADLGKPRQELDLLALYVDSAENTTQSAAFKHGVADVRVGCQKSDGTQWQGCESNNKGVDLAKGKGAEASDEIKKEIEAFLAKKVKCFIPYTIGNDFNEDDLQTCGYGINSEGKIVDKDNNIMSNPLASVSEIQAQAIKNENEFIVSVIESELTDAMFEVIDDQQGFVNLTGWHKTANDGVINNLVGVPFVATGAGAVKSKNLALKSGEDIKIALSNNWFNQVLLSAYQSNQLKYTIDGEPLANLGDLGKELVAMGAGFIKLTDTLTANIELDAAPYVRFVDGKIELIANAVQFDAELSTNTSDCPKQPLNACVITLQDGKPFLSVEVSVKALLDIDVNDAVNPIKISKENLMIHITKAEGTKLTVLGKVEFDASDRGMLLPPIYAFMHDQLQDVLTSSWKPMQSTNDICMNNAMVDKFFPKEDGSDEGERVLRIKANSFDATDGSHLIVGASLTDGKKPDAATGLEVLNITLRHRKSCL